MNRLLAFSMGVVIAGVSSANTVTFATFSDPSANSCDPLFVHDLTARTLEGSWGKTGLTLITPGLSGLPSATNATFQTSKLALNELVPGVHAVGAGEIVFKDNDGQHLFTIAFSGASYFEGAGVGASELRGQNITVSGRSVPQGTKMTQFNLAFANQFNANGKITYTAAFTSSAAPVPEPASMIALGAGAVALANRRKRANSR